MVDRDHPVWRLWRGTRMWAELFQILLVSLLVLSGIHRFMLWLGSGLVWNSESPAASSENEICLPGKDCSTDQFHRVLIQIPVFNDAHALQSRLDCLKGLDYPRSLFQVQILDDSDDGSAEVNAALVEALVAEGVPITVIHREERTGFKAGALAHGMSFSDAEFVAIFDADFQIPEHFLSQTIPHFEDSRVGWVQCRWGFANRNRNFLTRAQARLLDGHFRIEHQARSHGGRFFNFNGTAGIWRRTAIKAAGGWSGKTVVEDTDLSLRAWDQGWKGIYRDDIVCDGWLPESFSAFRTQQRRWLAGGVDLFLKRKSDLSGKPFLTRFDFSARGLAPLVSVVVVLLAIWAPLRRIFPDQLGPEPWVFRSLGTPAFEWVFFSFAFIGVLVYYASTGGGRYSRWLESFLVLLLGTGFAFYASLCCFEGILGRVSVFERTPKTAGATGGRNVTLLEWAVFPLTAWLIVEVVLIGAWSVLPLISMSFVGLLWSLVGTRSRGIAESSGSTLSSPCRNVGDSVV